MMDLDVGICSEVEKKQKKKLLLDYLWDNLKNHNWWAYRYYLCELLALLNVIGECVDVLLSSECVCVRPMKCVLCLVCAFGNHRPLFHSFYYFHRLTDACHRLDWNKRKASRFICSFALKSDAQKKNDD